MTSPVLIPLDVLDGFDVWIGNTYAGTVWRDRTGYRWDLTWNDHNKPFVYGTVSGFDDGVAQIVEATR